MARCRTHLLYVFSTWSRNLFRKGSLILLNLSILSKMLTFFTGWWPNRRFSIIVILFLFKYSESYWYKFCSSMLHEIFHLHEFHYIYFYKYYIYNTITIYDRITYKKAVNFDLVFIHFKTLKLYIMNFYSWLLLFKTD